MITTKSPNSYRKNQIYLTNVNICIETYFVRLTVALDLYKDSAFGKYRFPSYHKWTMTSILINSSTLIVCPSKSLINVSLYPHFFICYIK